MGRHHAGGVHISDLFAGSHTTENFVDRRTGELMLLMVPVTCSSGFTTLHIKQHKKIYNSRSKSLPSSRRMNSSSSSWNSKTKEEKKAPRLFVHPNHITTSVSKQTLQDE
jgi:hypothetical protein